MIYVVTGHPRSGTSMMMAALHAGGMRVAYSPARASYMLSRVAPQASGFNPSGLWELGLGLLQSGSWARDCQGMVVKLVWGQLQYIPPDSGPFRVLSMWRHPEEVHQSYEAALGGERLKIRHNYMQRYKGVMSYLYADPGVVSVVKLAYADVVADPVGRMQELLDMDWPIDVEAAAAVVDPSLYRFKLGETILEGA